MNNHTPGPWYVDGDYVSGVDIGNTEGTSIFYACCCGHVTGDSEQRTANARLIAAAPEMYELLEEYAEIVDADAAADWFQRRQALLDKIEGGGE